MPLTIQGITAKIKAILAHAMTAPAWTSGENTGGILITETRKTGERAKNMQHIFGALFHRIARELKWQGFDKAIELILADEAIAKYMGGTYIETLTDMRDDWNGEISEAKQLAALTDKLLNPKLNDSQRLAIITEMHKLKG